MAAAHTHRCARVTHTDVHRSIHTRTHTHTRRYLHKIGHVGFQHLCCRINSLLHKLAEILSWKDQEGIGNEEAGCLRWRGGGGQPGGLLPHPAGPRSQQALPDTEPGASLNPAWGRGQGVTPKTQVGTVKSTCTPRHGPPQPGRNAAHIEEPLA